MSDVPVKKVLSPGYTLDEWRAMGRHLTVNGRSLFVVDSDFNKQANNESRKALLLIHGFPTACWDWHHQFRELAAHYRVVTFDMLGFGYSDKPFRHRYSIHEQADLAVGLLQQLEISNCAILAHDYGDTVAQEMLARHREASGPKIEAACLLNGGLFPETHRARLIQKLLVGPLGGIFVHAFRQGSLKRNLTKIFGPNSPPQREELENFWALTVYNDGQRNLHRLMRYMKDRRQHRTRWLEALTHTDVPLCLINGSSDPISGSHMVARYRELVNKGTIVELEGIGHYPQLEAPEPVTRHALSFFQETL